MGIVEFPRRPVAETSGWGQNRPHNIYSVTFQFSDPLQGGDRYPRGGIP